MEANVAVPARPRDLLHGMCKRVLGSLYSFDRPKSTRCTVLALSPRPTTILLGLTSRWMKLREWMYCRRAGRGITLYRTIRFKERIQCIGPSEFTGPRESVNVIPNWEECITGNYWAYYTHRVDLGDAAHDAGTKLLPRKCRISTMPVSIGMSENPGNRICAIFLPPQYSC